MQTHKKQQLHTTTKRNTNTTQNRKKKNNAIGTNKKHTINTSSYVNIQQIEQNNEKIWLISSVPHVSIQILDKNYKLDTIIDWIDSFISLKKLIFSDSEIEEIIVK